MKYEQCPFCEIARVDSFDRIIDQNSEAFVIEDGFPVTPGHSLIIPRRHIKSLFNTTSVERNALFSLIENAKAVLDQRYKPSAYNVGVNDGPAAGQTIPHLHIHLIPRYEEPESDPRGGIRWVIPEKADYWSKR